MTHFTVVLEQVAWPTTGQEVKASILPLYETKNDTRLSALVILVGTWERKSRLGKKINDVSQPLPIYGLLLGPLYVTHRHHAVLSAQD